MRIPALFSLVVVAACSSSSPGGAPLSNATSLRCPTPGTLPFALASSGYQSADNASLVEDAPRDKDEAGDILGVPGATSANVYLDDAAPPMNGLASFHGRKARTGASSGLTAKALPGEYVSLWTYDGAKWTTLGRTKTDDSGSYDIAASATPTAGRPVYALLEADASCAEHVSELLPQGTKVIVTDIDGTLTTSDDELLKEAANGSYEPAMMMDANGLMQAWDAKKYAVVYLTARTHVFRADTRQWLDALSFPLGPVITSNALTTSDAATTAYKTAWLRRMVTSFGWQVVAAYGNALTDIAAYQAVGIPNDRIFIVGPNGGAMGSTPIANMDFTAHVDGFVKMQPDNG